MRSVDVVGGSGFIGTRLVNRLSSHGSYSVKIIDKVSSRAFPGLSVLADVRQADQLRQAVSEEAVLINLAAEHRDDVRPRSLYHDVNVEGARNLVAVAREKKIGVIVFTSSVAVYGFAPIGTDEAGRVAPFNDYGRTKYEAEKVLSAWQEEAPAVRTLVIVRPTVVFGERNRGNVYNLLRQVASGGFVMVGYGTNRKSVAYVENVAAFIEFGMSFSPGVHIFNYVDKPDLSMTKFIGIVNRMLGRPEKVRFRLPYAVGYLIGVGFDLIAAISRRRFAISAIRVKKFCSNSVYNTAVDRTDFSPPVPLEMALEKTVRFEFVERNCEGEVYYSE